VLQQSAATLQRIINYCSRSLHIHRTRSYRATQYNTIQYNDTTVLLPRGTCYIVTVSRFRRCIAVKRAENYSREITQSKYQIHCVIRPHLHSWAYEVYLICGTVSAHLTTLQRVIVKGHYVCLFVRPSVTLVIHA